MKINKPEPIPEPEPEPIIIKPRCGPPRIISEYEKGKILYRLL